MNNTTPSLIVIGDVSADLVLGPMANWPARGTEQIMERSELRPGGSAGNAALALSYLGVDCQLLSLIGNDNTGSWLKDQFNNISASLPVCKRATSMSVGIIHPCSERTFFTTKGHLEELDYWHITPRLVPAPYPGSIALLSGVFLSPKIRESYNTLIEKLKALGYSIALDIGWPAEGWSTALRQEISSWISKCDHILLNELEATSFADCDQLEPAIKTFDNIMHPNACLVIKTGKKGAVGYKSGKFYAAAAKQVFVFDTIGAGDSFNAGYLVARLKGRNLTQSLTMGCETASSIIARFPRRNIAPGELANHITLADFTIGHELVEP